MKRFYIGIFVTLVTLLSGCAGEPMVEDSGDLESVQIMSDEYPRVFFFRQSESPGKDPNLTYEDWEGTFQRLMGIIGKVQDEEIPGLSSRNIDFFTRFKKSHPGQIVLMHYNGNARDPRFDTADYHAGHWIYFNGSKITRDVPAEGGETEIAVENPNLYKTGIGRYKDKNEDIGLCMLDENGKPDWNRSEQVQLLSIDAAKKVMRVRRGAYGSKPMAFPAGRAYAAAHIWEGPWGEKSNLMWFYNYSTVAMRDPQGRTASDVAIEELLDWYSPGGKLAAFDGLEFDVLFFHNNYNADLRNPKSGRGMDINADGKIDGGIIAGVDTYGVGVVEFCRRLRERFPQNKILMADGMSERNQRAFEILNGIESEGFPFLRDLVMRDWSGGMNRHYYWRAHARPPVFNYINHKYVKTDPNSGRSTRADVPFGIHRLVFAAAMFTDAAICYSSPPKPEPGERLGIWDEFQRGADRELAWLGKPVGEAVRLAVQQPNLLEGVVDLAGQFQGSDVEITADGGETKIANKALGAGNTRFALHGLPAQGPDLFVTFDVRCQGMTGYPEEVARLMRVVLSGGDPRGFMTWVGEDTFRPGFYFSDVKTSKLNLEFEIEGSEPLWISNLTVHAHPDAMYREFERGVVLANPSPRPYTFQIAELFPGKSFRRIQASPAQDTTVNDGSKLGAELVLPGKDALFLVLEGSQ